MCGICGCNAPMSVHLDLQTSLLAANDRIADINRRYFIEHGILALNIVASPGAGKTALLEATARHYQQLPTPLHVIEGDQHTDNDAQRVRRAGAIAQQINTGHLCHLEARHIQQVLTEFPPAVGALLMIENVGNLVCPASFDLGEHMRVVVISTPEGDDKPLKYPDIIANADLLVISKADLTPHVDFNVQACIDNARRIRPDLEALVLSAKTNEGLIQWLAWLNAQQQQFRQETSPPPSSDLR